MNREFFRRHCKSLNQRDARAFVGPWIGPEDRPTQSELLDMFCEAWQTPHQAFPAVARTRIMLDCIEPMVGEYGFMNPWVLDIEMRVRLGPRYLPAMQRLVKSKGYVAPRLEGPSRAILRPLYDKQVFLEKHGHYQRFWWEVVPLNTPVGPESLPVAFNCAMREWLQLRPSRKETQRHLDAILSEVFWCILEAYGYVSPGLVEDVATEVLEGVVYAEKKRYLKYVTKHRGDPTWHEKE